MRNTRWDGDVGKAIRDAYPDPAELQADMRRNEDVTFPRCVFWACGGAFVGFAVGVCFAAFIGWWLR